VLLKDESDRLGLPAFKILGASWAVERGLKPDVHTLVAASAGNHGRAVARCAAWRGLECRVFLPERTPAARVEAIAGEGAETVLRGDYETVVALAEEAGRDPGVLLVTDTGDAPSAHDVIEGYATLFEEIGDADLLVVPVGVGSLAAAAVRTGIPTIGVEPESAACLAAALEAGEPVRIPTPGTVLGPLDCAEVSAAAWPDLRRIAAIVTVSDDELEPVPGLEHLGDCSLAAVAGLRKLELDPAARTVVIATEGIS
jgi:diaminopropionate ammonia-lyase